MYTTQERVEAYLNRALTDNEALSIDDVISSISTMIDNYTNRSWLSVDETLDDYQDEATTKYFDGNGNKELFVDDFITPTKITINDSQGSMALEFTEDTDWVLSPLNSGVKTAIFLRNYHFPVGIGNIAIEAIWGAGVVPAGIVMIATALVGKYYLKVALSTTTGQFKSESIEGYSYTLQSGADIDSETDTLTGSLMSGLDIYKRIKL